jgi:hypothetical protein
MNSESVLRGRPAFDVSRIARGLRFVGIAFLLFDMSWAALRAYLYFMSVLPRAATDIGLVKDARRIAGGVLCLLAAAGLSSRQEWGRRLTRNVVVVGSLFGVTALILPMIQNGPRDPFDTMLVIAWFGLFVYAFSWLSRPDVREQFVSDVDGSGRRPLARRLGPFLLLVICVVAIVTTVAEVRGGFR